MMTRVDDFLPDDYDGEYIGSDEEDIPQGSAVKVK